MPLPLLDGVLVAEVGTSISARFAGRLLADLGAEVIAIEGAIRAPERGQRQQRMDDYLMANKRRAVLDLNEPGVLHRIRERADIVLYDRSMADDADLLSERPESPSVVAVITPFGLHGPHTALHEDELLFFALSGMASVTPATSDDPARERPMQPYGHQAACLGGVVAAVASLQAWLGAEQTGRGAVLDVPIMDALGSALMGEIFTHVESAGPEALRPTGRRTGSLLGMLPCRDGYLYTPGGGGWDVWAEILDRPAWIQPPYDSAEYRLEHWEEVEQEIQQTLSTWTAEELYRAAQARGIAAFPANSIARVVQQPHLQARGVFETILPATGSGRELKAPRTPIRVQDGRGPERTPDVLRPQDADTAYARERLLHAAARPATPVSADAPPLPLEGVRVADFSWVIAGPQSTKWMAALGAEVIKVESRRRPDPTRRSSPWIDGNPESLEGSPHYLMLNSSKRDCTINLATPEGRDLARRLVLSSDIVIENYSTGAVEAMGLDFAELVKEKPDLIMVSSSGMGRTGPDARMRAYGTPIHAYSGHTYLASWPGTPPRGQGVSWTDPVTGEVAVLAMLAGLTYVRRTGRELHFDLSMVEITIGLMFEAYVEQLAGHEPIPVGNRSANCAPHNTYRCKDGWVAITAHNDQEWRSLATLIGARQLADLSLPKRAAQVEEIDAAIDQWSAARSRDEAIQALDGAQVCAVSVTELHEVVHLRHFRERDLLLSLEKNGVGKYIAYKLPWQSRPRVEPRYLPAPNMGQDNEYVFRNILGLSEHEFERLVAIGVIR